METEGTKNEIVTDNSLISVNTPSSHIEMTLGNNSERDSGTLETGPIQPILKVCINKQQIIFLYKIKKFGLVLQFTNN